MGGILTNLKDMAKSFDKMKAIGGAEARKQAVISEFRSEFIRQGKSCWLAQQLAEEKYKQIHKHG